MPQEDLSAIRESLFTELAAVYVSFDTVNSPECSALSSLSLLSSLIKTHPGPHRQCTLGIASY